MFAEDDEIVCGRCERVIRYEKPLFCPYCGAKLEHGDERQNEEERVELYPSSHMAPRMMKAFVLWVVFVVPVTLAFGRSGFIALSFIFLFVLLLYLFLGLRLPDNGRKS